MQKLIFITDINFKESPQVRAESNPSVALEYSERYRNKEDMPPIHLFWDADKKIMYLADGMHRCNAMELIGRRAIEAEVHQGDYQEALKYALLANASHGLPRSQADKQQCIRMALKQWPSMSDLAIAKVTSTSDKTVATIREKMVAKKVIPETQKISSSGAKIAVRNSEPASKEDTEVAVPQDELGREIPIKVQKFWERQPEVMSMLESIGSVISQMKDAQKEKDEMYGEVPINGVIADLEKAYAAVQCAIPFAVCPTCQGHPETQKAGCRMCYGKGGISKFRYKTIVPEETRKMLEKGKGK